MSRAALLLVVGEAFNEKQKTLILDKITEGNSPFEFEFRPMIAAPGFFFTESSF